MKRLSFRFCRRALLIIAILFPIVYLCGGLFFALAGSHGNFDWHDNTFVQWDYETAMQMENFKYSDWDWENEHGTRLGFSKGYLNFNIQDDVILGLHSDGVAVGYYSYYDSGDSPVNFGLGFYNNVGYCALDLYFDSNVLFLDLINVSESIDYTFYGCLYFVDVNDEVVYSFIASYSVNGNYDLHVYFNDTTTSDGWLPFTSTSWEAWDGVVSIYFDDGANLPEGVEWNDELRSYFVPTLKPIESNSLSDYIFSQPFASDNFITSLGRGILDDTAFGFPPFRDMFNWFNDSVMHIESDDALGVFGLGYAYYAMNVVAVYELVVLVLMVFMLPLRITDKFMGEHL